MTNDKADFTQGNILKKLVAFMMPILGALILQAAYGAVDLLVVGRFGSTSGLSAVSITDFPIRDHKVILLLRRRKWVDIRTGKSFILPLKIAAEGTRYSKEFAAFLKETYGHIPGDLPYA